jgi:fumarate reductase flavoprotein subunit
VTVSESAITDVKVTKQMETPGVGEVAANEIPKRIVEQQSLAVDVVAGVTISSASVLSAVVIDNKITIWYRLLS